METIKGYVDHIIYRNSENGYTVAVLGFGIDQCYPVEHQKLKCAIAENGLLISEYPPGTFASKFRFPRRNRIIAGLSDVLYAYARYLESELEIMDFEKAYNEY